MMGDIQGMSSRYLNYINNDLVIPFNKKILVVDNGCDQIIANVSAFLLNLLPVYYLM